MLAQPPNAGSNLAHLWSERDGKAENSDSPTLITLARATDENTFSTLLQVSL